MPLDKTTEMSCSIVLIGSGNVATCIGRNARRCGMTVKSVLSRSENHARKLAGLLGAAYTTCFADLPCDADVYVVAVRDDALDDVVKELPRVDGALFIHTAGCREMDVFKGFEALYGVMYPMQSFSQGRDLDFKEIPCFLEANDEQSQRLLNVFASALSNRLYQLNTEKRKRLHLAAVFASNFTNRCFVESARLLKKIGLPFDVMLPLIDETVDKVHTLSPEDAQTGPANRGDKQAVEMEGKLIDDVLLKELYDLMSENILKDKKR